MNMAINSLRASDWVTIAAILVAMVAVFLFVYTRSSNLKNKYKQTLSTIIKDFILDLERIKTVRNPLRKRKTDNIVFDNTSRSEVFGYNNIFETLILQNYHLYDKGNADIIFLYNYQKNIQTIKVRTSDDTHGYLTLETIDRLLDLAQKCV